MTGACVGEGSQPATITPVGGHAFLGGSHFSIGHDETYTKPGLQSVFKQDYPAWDIHGAPPGIKPPAPSHLHHEDVRYVSPMDMWDMGYMYWTCTKRESQIISST